MSKKLMAAGKIIRRLVDNKPVGPWMVITMSNAYYVYADVIGHPDNGVILQRSHVFLPKIVRLCISKEKAQEIINGETIVTHTYIKTWDSAKDADLVLLYTHCGSTKIYCTIEECRKIILLREMTVRIIINRIVMLC